MMVLITFRSVTPAQRGEGLLKRAGLECRLQRTPRWMEEKGCGYSLVINQKNAEKAAQLLRRNQIPFGKIYLRQDDGSVEEMAL